jgi:tetratricopeptide (TPR) repeat protein
MLHMLILGMGYSASRLAARLRAEGWQVTGVRRSADAQAIAFDDEPAVRAAIAGATHILSSVPPEGEDDPVLTRYGAAIAAAPALWVGYLSSTGVYGDAAGAWVDEASPVGQGRRTARARADLYARAAAMSSLGRFDDAIMGFARVLALEPGNVDAFFYLGSAHYNLGHYDDAATHFEAALRIDAGHLQSHHFLGNTYFALKKYASAITAYRRAIEIDPSDAKSRYFLGMTYLVMNERGYANEQYVALKHHDGARAKELYASIFAGK